MDPYGFEFKKADGGTFFNSTQSGLRLVASHFISRGWSGVISEPNFNITNGAWFLKPYLLVTAWAGVYTTLGASRRPSLSWDDTAKEMTVTANPGNAVADSPVDYKLKFFHYV